MTKYKGLFTFDEDNHRYVPIAQADGIIDTMGYEPDSEPAEPLIKDEKIRKAVRAWAEVLKIDKVEFYGSETWIGFRARSTGTDWLSKFELDYFGSKNTLVPFRDYTIAELCGEEEG